MAIVASTNFSLAGGYQYSWATADGDVFDRTHVATPAQALENHTHAAGLGLQVPTGGIANLAITTALLAAGAVTNAKLASGAVKAANVASGEHFTPWAYGPPPGPFG